MDEVMAERTGLEKHEELVAREGLPIIIPVIFIALIFAGLGWVIPAAVMGVLGVFSLWFFRNPKRVVSGGEEVISSPADGKVIEIKKDARHELLTGPQIKVSIFMSIFNAHINRVPCGGRVEKVKYYPGKFFSANLDKASHENERNAVLIKRPDGKMILTVQIAGLIARRIACWVREGMEVSRGERFGLIRFGSRLEVFLPPEALVLVKEGDKVRAGETPLGEVR